jgi:hypothetical protein
MASAPVMVQRRAEASSQWEAARRNQAPAPDQPVSENDL